MIDTPANAPALACRERRRRRWSLPTSMLALLVALSSCRGTEPPPADGTATTSSTASQSAGELKVLRLPMRSDGPKSTDPIRGSTTYDNTAAVQVYETLLQYKYLVRPSELEPLLLAEMPTISDDRMTYRFRLKPGVRFHDDPCFEGGKGRELVAADVFYSWKRMADKSNNPKCWWLLKDTIVGFDEYRTEQHAALDAGQPFDYDKPVEGLRIINDHEFEVVLKEPVYRFMWVLAMFQTSVVPREAVETYGTRFGRHPVGTGPFLLKEDDWQAGKSMSMTRNPNYHEAYYPSEHMPEDVPLGLHQAAGARLPIADRLEFTMFIQDQPMWLQFKSGTIDYTQVPAEYFTEAYVKRTQELRPEYVRDGIVSHAIPLLDFIFRGFNMEDPLLGGYDEKKIKLRRALNLAQDLDERNDSFYNGTNIVYDGVIPPGVDGYPPNGRLSGFDRGPDLDLAKQLLAEAGYPDGKGLPTIEFYTSRTSNGPEQVEMLVRQLSRINVKLNVRLVDFSQLIEAVDNKKAPWFSFAWSSDYPDGENNLALFYGPNEAPGSNHFNFKNAEYDRLYSQIRTMPPSPERRALYDQMNRMLVHYAPYGGAMARTRYYLINPWLQNFRPSEDFYNWIKYLDVDESKRK